MDRIDINDPFDGIHNPTGYLDRAEMHALESGDALPFDDLPPIEWEFFNPLEEWEPDEPDEEEFDR